MKKGLFIDVWDIVRSNADYFFYIFIGGRGKGKTYSALKEFCTGKHKGQLLYVRRTETEIDTCCNAYFNPFKKLNEDLGVDIRMEPAGKNKVVINQYDGEQVRQIGYAGALSTFGKLRGADFSDVDSIVFDEFINTAPVNTLKRGAFLLFNLIETVNRNREFNNDGTVDKSKSVKVLLLSNSNTVDDDIIRTLNLAEQVRKMKEKNKEVYTDKKRGLYFQLFGTGLFEDTKEKTRLYQLTKGTAFYDMALKNEFTTDYFGDVNNKINYNQLVPFTAIDNIYFYREKSGAFIFASRRKANVKNYSMREFNQFKRDYGFYVQMMIDAGKIYYENYSVKLDVLNLGK